MAAFALSAAAALAIFVASAPPAPATPSKTLDLGANQSFSVWSWNVQRGFAMSGTRMLNTRGVSSFND